MTVILSGAIQQTRGVRLFSVPVVVWITPENINLGITTTPVFVEATGSRGPVVYSLVDKQYPDADITVDPSTGRILFNDYGWLVDALRIVVRATSGDVHVDRTFYIASSYFGN